MPYARNKDKNHNEIQKLLESCGVSVFDSSRFGDGFTDMVLGFRGVTDLAEIKNGDRDWKLEDKQKIFHETWNGSKPLIFTSVNDALTWIKRVSETRK